MKRQLVPETNTLDFSPGHSENCSPLMQGGTQVSWGGVSSQSGVTSETIIAVSRISLGYILYLIASRVCGERVNELS